MYNNKVSFIKHYRCKTVPPKGNEIEKNTTRLTESLMNIHD